LSGTTNSGSSAAFVNIQAMQKQLVIQYRELAHWSELDAAQQPLVAKAQAICAQAYAPYSQFKVGAVLVLENGMEITGNNQENIAYPSGLCAERVALFYAGAQYPGVAVETLLIVADGDLIQPEDCLSPCGSCRQVIAESEFRQEKPMRVILVSQSGRTFVFEKGTDLLVFPFGMH
jgi:cytidine deaminase